MGFLNIAWAVLGHRKLYSSSKEELDPLGSDNKPLEHLPDYCSVAGEPHADTVGKDALCGALAKGLVMVVLS